MNTKNKINKYIYIFDKSTRMRTCGNFQSDFLTTVSNTKAAGEQVDVSIVSPGCHIDEEVRRVLNCEAKSESVDTNIWEADM